MFDICGNVTISELKCQLQIKEKMLNNNKILLLPSYQAHDTIFENIPYPIFDYYLKKEGIDYQKLGEKVQPSSL